MNIFQGVFWIIIHVRNSVRNSVPSNNTQLYFLTYMVLLRFQMLLNHHLNPVEASQILKYDLNMQAESGSKFRLCKLMRCDHIK